MKEILFLILASFLIHSFAFNCNPVLNGKNYDFTPLTRVKSKIPFFFFCCPFFYPINKKKRSSNYMISRTQTGQGIF